MTTVGESAHRIRPERRSGARDDVMAKKQTRNFMLGPTLFVEHPRYGWAA